MINYLGQNIKQIREYWGLSQEEFGHLVGATRGMIAQYEARGSRPKGDVARRIEDLFKVPFGYLENEVVNKNNYPDMPKAAQLEINKFRARKFSTEKLSKEEMERLNTRSGFELRKAGGLLAHRRNELGISPKRLANLVGIDEDMYEQIENGQIKPSSEVIDKISDFLSIDNKVRDTYYPHLHLRARKLSMLARLKAVIETLRLNNIITNLADISNTLDLRMEYISPLINGEWPFSDDDKFLIKFCTNYGVNQDFITIGKGPVFSKSDSKKILFTRTLSNLVNRDAMRVNQEGMELSIENTDWAGVPIYDVTITAGAVEMISEGKAPYRVYYLRIPGFNGCTFGARVSDDSMYPEIRNGDYVVCKEIQTLDSLIYGDIYLVITKDGVETVKYVHPHETDRDWINLVPYNKSIPVVFEKFSK